MLLLVLLLSAPARPTAPTSAAGQSSWRYIRVGDRSELGVGVGVGVGGVVLWYDCLATIATSY